MSAIRRKLKWCDFIRRPERESSDGTTPVFMFAESRGVAWTVNEGYAGAKPTDDELVASVRAHIGDPALGRVECCDFIGHDYVSMEWKDRRYFWHAMEAFLLRGIGVAPQCRLVGFWFAPSDLALPWAPETAERALVRTVRAQHAKYPDMHLVTFRDLCYTHPSSWLTDEGRALVVDARKWLYKRAEPSSSDEELPADWLDEVPVSVAAAATPPLPPVVPDPPVAAAVVEDESLCVVCQDAQADTLALPCMHVVCCAACSAKLRDTPNARTCLVCRQPIAEVLLDVK